MNRSTSSLHVEIVGLAGSGKSTLTRCFGVCDPRHRVDGPLRFRDARHLRYVAHSAPRLIPLLVSAARARRAPTWTELKLLIYLMEWPRWLSHHSARRAGVTFIDQGPVYALARLRHTEPPVAGTDPSDHWWKATTAEWSRVLDAIVWLDAPDEVLRQRVDRRNQEHEVKNVSTATAVAFIDSYRRSYDLVLRALDRSGGPTVLRYDTSRRSCEEIAADVLARLAEPRDIHELESRSR